MRVTCPKCEFAGNIRDELIPPEGKNVNCPKCKTSIFVKNESQTKTEINDTHTTPATPTQIFFKHQINTYIAVAGCVVFLLIGILIGTQINKTDNPIMAGKTQPEFQENTTPPQPEKNSPTPVDIDKVTPPPHKPVPNESDFVSSAYIDDYKIEEVLAKTEGMTTVQEEEYLISCGRGYITKTIRGDFIIEDVFEINSLFEKVYPVGMYTHIIRASNNKDYEKNFTIYIGTNKQELVRGISKKSMAYIEGYILAFSADFGMYYFYIANAKVDFL